MTLASLRADLANAKAANHRQHTDLTALRRLLGQDALADLDHPTTGTGAASSRLSQLEHELFQLQIGQLDPGRCAASPDGRDPALKDH